jgi:hypothetical protein
MGTRNPPRVSKVLEFALFREAQHPPGTLPALIPIEPSAAEFPHVSCALNLARDILGTQAARQALLQLAMAWDAYHGRVRFQGKAHLARKDVDLFAIRVRNRLPKVIVDENMTNPRVLGTHSRLPWEGTKAQFRPEDQTVSINASVGDLGCANFLDLFTLTQGQRCKDLVRASKHSEDSQYRRFIFQLACTFVHEIGGHMFVTFLIHGNRKTPLNIGPRQSQEHGVSSVEAGRFLERRLFGGNLEFYRDATKDEHQVRSVHRRVFLARIPSANQCEVRRSTFG